MLTSIPPILNAAHMGVNSRSCFGVISNRAFSEKIKQIAIACFKACTSLYFGTFGTTELIQGTHKKIVSSDNYSNKTEALKSSKAFLNLHGSLMLGCCSLTLIDALHAFGVIAMGSMATILSNAGSVLFLCANVFALEENIRLYGMTGLCPLPLFYDLRGWFAVQGVDPRGLHSCDIGPAIGLPFEGRSHNALDDVRSIAGAMAKMAARGLRLAA